MATTTKYLWDDEIDAVAMETDGAGTTQAVYNSDPVPYGRLFSMRRGGKTYDYRYDGNGNTRALTDSTGQLTDTYRYSAFGEERAHTGTTENPYRFGGQHGYQFNQASDDYYVRARVYQPKRGRWRSKDPLQFFDGLNRFFYSQSNPTALSDPSGFACLVTYVCNYVHVDLQKEGCFYDCWEKRPAEQKTVQGTGKGKHWNCGNFKDWKHKFKVKRHTIAHYIPSAKGCGDKCPDANDVEFGQGWDGYDPNKACSLSQCVKDCGKKAGFASAACAALPKGYSNGCAAAMKVGGETCKSFCNFACFKK